MGVFKRLWSVFLIAAIAGCTVALGVGTSTTRAATVCVSTGGSGGCYATIQAAVDAAAAGDTVSVPAGTFKENVVIKKAITLQGAGAGKTIVDGSAGAKQNAITVQSVTSGQTTVSGLTAENAQLSGIAVLESANVTVSNTVIQNNDTNLKFDPTTLAGSCAGADAFDQDDCGEGLHLRGVKASTITGNVVQGNAGGILVTDETGPSSGNVIKGNTVQNNILDCGITLASHPAGIVPPTTPNGRPTFKPGGTIFNNQILNNTVSGNGAAGVGIFASTPGTASFNNLVEGNTITNNGLPGVTLHSHAPGQKLDGNRIINNVISGNAIGQSLLGAAPGDPDAGDFVSTGILVLAAALPIHGTVISGNIITDETIGIWLTNTAGTVNSGNSVSATWPLVQAAPPNQYGAGAATTTDVSQVAFGSVGTTSSFTVAFSSTKPGRGEILFGSGPGCAGLVGVATQDQSPGGTSHVVTVTGNDLPGAVGNVGIQQGATYSYEIVTVTPSGTEVNNNNGKCFQITVPPASR